MNESKLFISGPRGQLGTALRAKYPLAQYADIEALDITDERSVTGFDWSDVEILVNAAAFTDVDAAESLRGRRSAWLVNAAAVANLANIARKHGITLVHISSDYVFDGQEKLHNEDESLSPLSAYGASKAAGDLLVAQLPHHYIVRTSWVIGEGSNFVRTMLRLGIKGTNPSVVNDQVGRLTFTSELVRGIDHLLTGHAEYGTYNISNDGDILSWADIAKEIFSLAQLNVGVEGVTTQQYFEGKTGIALRPANSALDLSKIQTTGFRSRDWRKDLADYIYKEQAQ